MKTCASCDVEKEDSDFNANGKGGLCSWCKQCKTMGYVAMTEMFAMRNLAFSNIHMSRWDRIQQHR